jgi:signal transduction histidine kinase
MVATHLSAAGKKMTDAIQSGLKRSALDEFLETSRSSSEILVRNLTKAAELVSSFKQVAVDQTSSQRRRFNLAEMVAEVVTTLGPALRKTPYVIKQSISEDILMDSFPGPLGQVVTNLINNAVVHAFEGRAAGEIHIEAVKCNDGKAVVLKITDNGVGISAETLPRIFDPFFTTKLGQGGSGLGLNIVYNMVCSILTGRIGVESEVGKGTCFTLTLATTATDKEAGSLLAAPVAHRSATNMQSGLPSVREDFQDGDGI